MTQMAVIKNKRKRKKSGRCKVHVYDGGYPVSCSVIVEFNVPPTLHIIGHFGDG